MKIAQLYSQIFIYILTIVLVSFILVYGYTAVKNFKERADQVSCLKFKNDMQNAISSVSSDFGTVKRKDLSICGRYTGVCFVESFTEPDIPYETDPIIMDSVRSGSGNNVFLIEGIAKEPFYAGNISVGPDDVLCIEAAGGKISLRLEGKGNHVILSEWS